MIEKKCTTCKNLLFKYEPCGTQIVSCDEGVFVDEYTTRSHEESCSAWADRWIVESKREYATHTTPIAESNPEWRRYD